MFYIHTADRATGINGSCVGPAGGPQLSDARADPHLPHELRQDPAQRCYGVVIGYNTLRALPFPFFCPHLQSESHLLQGPQTPPCHTHLRVGRLAPVQMYNVGQT